MTVKRPDGTVLEIPITSEELNRLISNVSGNPRIVLADAHQRRREKVSDDFPTDEQIKDFLKDGDKTVHQLAEHFLGRKINSHADTSIYHKFYNAKARVLKRT